MSERTTQRTTRAKRIYHQEIKRAARAMFRGICAEHCLEPRAYAAELERVARGAERK